MVRPPIPVLQQVALRPVAAPVDTFVQPARSRLLDVASALEPLDRGLQEWAQNRKVEADKVDRIRGEADFYNGTKVEQAEGVRRGLIPADRSPAYMEAYKGAQGNVAGGQLREKFSAEFDAWEGKNDEKADFNTFYQDFLKRNITSDDPYVLKGLLPSVREIEANGRSRFIEYRSKQTEANSLNAHVASASQALDDADAAGLASEKGTDYATLWTTMDKRRQSFIDAGGNPEEYDKTLMDAMSLKAVEKRDPNLIKFFDQKVPGKDYTFGDTPYGAKIKAATIENLETIARRAEVEDSQAQTAADKKAEDDAKRSTIDFLTKDPTAELPPGLVESGSKAIPDYQIKVREWRKTLNEGLSDNDDLMSVRDAVLKGGGTKAVTDAFEAGVFKNPEDLNAAMTFAKGYEENRDRIEDSLGTASAKDIQKVIDRQTNGLSEFGTVLPGITDEGREATYDFNRMVTDWTIANPQATFQEREDFIAKAGNTILSRLKPIKEAGPGEVANTYERPEEANKDFRNPITDKGGVKAQLDGDVTERGEPTQRDRQVDAGQPSADPDVEPFLRNLQPDQQAAFADAAKKQGKTTEQLAIEMLDGNKGQRYAYDPASTDLGEGDARPTEMTPDIAGKFIEEALMESGVPAPGKAGDLKSLIRQHEAAGNYNAVYGQPQSKVDLSQYTLDDILGQQQYARRRGAKSTAIGGYQFIYKTLKGLKQSMGLTGSENFTPELQDRMADVLLDGRGMSRFLSGKMSARQFALGLSQEWASLPNPNTGRSFYAGDGLNASSVSPSKVFAALGILGLEGEAQADGDLGGPSAVERFLYGDAAEPGYKGLKDTMGIELRPDTKSNMEPFDKQAAGDFLLGDANKDGFKLKDALGVDTSKKAPLSKRGKKPLTGKEFLLGDAADPNFEGVVERMGIETKASQSSAAYSKIPDVDEAGNAGQREKFIEWNSDPVANHEANLKSIEPKLADVVRKAQELTGVRIVVGSGKRDEALQKKAKEWGWSKTEDSDHLHGGAVDLWGLDADGAVTFDKKTQKEIVKAMRVAAKELGVELDIGADWNGFKDNPHFALKGGDHSK